MAVIWRLLGYLRPHMKLVLAAIFSMMIVVVMGFIIPWITRFVIDFVIIDGQWELLFPLSLAVVGAAIVNALFFFVRRYASALVGQHVIFDLRNELYRHLHKLPFSFYDQAQTGELMSRVTQDVETMRRFLGFGVVNIIRSGLMFFGVLIFLMMVNMRLTLLVLLTLPPLALTVRAFSRRVRPMYRRVQQRLADLTTVLQENIAGLRVIRSLSEEDHEIEKFNKRHEAYLEDNVATIRSWAFFFPLMNMITGVGTVLILWVGGRDVIAGRMTLGWLIAYNQYLWMLLGPLRMLGWLVNLTERASASGSRVFELLDRQSDIRPPKDPVYLSDVRGNVTFSNLWFRYENSDSWVLRGIDLQVAAGQRIAFLGATGSGKTTLINLIPRFYDPDEGRIQLDGVDLDTIDLLSLRRQIGTVMQETFLFSASIAENIAYGRPEATREAIIEVAQAAQIHDSILDLPDGYDTLIGERGVGLSGGQKQRVAIARALLMDPPILILDDSTSSVDAETEHLIQMALDRLMRGRTSFIIAQRLSSVKDAHQIIVLDQGVIVQKGTHDELLRQSGIYREIHQLQSSEQADISESVYVRAREMVSRSSDSANLKGGHYESSPRGS